MSKHYLDFNQPIMHNRQEKIAVKFNGCIKNACETMLIAMLDNDFNHWVSRYPGLDDIIKLGNVKEVYYRLMYFTPKSFLTEMRKPYKELSENEITQDISRLLGDLVIPERSSFTSLEIGIREIVKYDFCETITVYDTSMNDATKMYIAKLFHSYENKAYMYTGFLKELVEDSHGITTFFIDDIEELMILMEKYEYNKETEKLKEKQFFVQGLNCITGRNKDGSPIYKYEDYMKDSIERFDCNVTWITSHYIDLSNPNPIVDLNDYVKPKETEDNANSVD